MVDTVTKEGDTFYECEACGMLFEIREEASEHEANCDAEDPTYIA
jgi:uncharacterized C2H2 Zn-finger protein